jgi:uncharacterized protein YndB with AHSA1/START domain
MTDKDILSSAHDIVSSRVLAAPPAQVCAAFSDPRRLAQWWGPNGFTNTFHEFDLRPGGRWRFTMHGPDGTDYPTEKEFTVVEPPARIVFRHRQTTHNFEMTLTFVAEAGGTRLTWLMRFDSADECAGVRQPILEANEQNFDRLAAHLSKIP